MADNLPQNSKHSGKGNGSSLVGIVSRTDVLEALMRHADVADE
jgi:CBS-domain-containing membrane protein